MKLNNNNNYLNIKILELNLIGKIYTLDYNNYINEFNIKLFNHGFIPNKHLHMAVFDENYVYLYKILSGRYKENMNYFYDNYITNIDYELVANCKLIKKITYYQYYRENENYENLCYSSE